MPRKIPPATTFDHAIAWLRDHAFTISEQDGDALVTKYGCAARLVRLKSGAVAMTEKPAVLLGGEMAKLVDRGYQKFLMTSKLQIAATSDHLHAMQRMSEELQEAVGKDSLYNLALGTVSDEYIYDRVKGRRDDGIPGDVRPRE
jgi:hypothetical protein